MALALTKFALKMEGSLIDYRQLTFDASKIEGITLVQDKYMGLGIITEVNGGYAVASLANETLYDVVFFKPDEGPDSRFYVPNCGLQLDLTAIGSHSKDPPLGSLIVAKKGISVMVKPPRSGPSPLRLVGEPISHPFEGICILRWQVESPAQLRKPGVLHSFNHQVSE